MIRFCHIAPTKLISKIPGNRLQQENYLLLAHLVEDDPNYVKATESQYRFEQSDNPRLRIMDNSAFEMFSRGEEMYSSEKLIEMGLRCKATHIVMSDYPGESSSKTLEAACEMIPKIKEQGFKTFFVPQSPIGRLEELVSSFAWGLNHPDIDLIGVSILAVPHAYGLVSTETNPAYKLQRFLSRWKFLQLLDDRGMLNGQENKLHFLGMTEGPKEIELVADYHRYINSWDSSAAAWCAVNDIEFDDSPTGLLNGKVEKPVDFDFDPTGSPKAMMSITSRLRKNVAYIEESCDV